MSFDPEKVERYSPLSSGGMGSDEMGGFVLYYDYAQLLTLLHDVSTEADPSGTRRENIMLQDKIAAQEVLIQELRREIARLIGDSDDQ